MAFWKRKKSDAAQQADSGRQPALQYSDLGITHPYTTNPQTDADFYWQSLEQEAIADLIEQQYVLPWEELFQLLADPEHASAIPLLNLPSQSTLRPIIRSQGALSDADFKIILDGWCDPNGQKINQPVQRVGGVISRNGN